MPIINTEVWKNAKISVGAEYTEGMDSWFDGVWYDGEWESGSWNNGVWIHGLWKDGYWFGGTWCDGKWCKGDWGDPLPVIENITLNWISGIWVKGRIFNDTQSDWVYSKTSPKTYYKPVRTLSINHASYKQ